MIRIEITTENDAGVKFNYTQHINEKDMTPGLLVPRIKAAMKIAEYCLNTFLGNRRQ